MDYSSYMFGFKEYAPAPSGDFKSLGATKRSSPLGDFSQKTNKPKKKLSQKEIDNLIKEARKSLKELNDLCKEIKDFIYA